MRRLAFVLLFALGTVPPAAAEDRAAAVAALDELTRELAATELDAARGAPLDELAPLLAPQARDTADAAALDRRTRAVAAQLRCPVCEGTSVEDSPDLLAQEMRGVIRDQLAAGRTEAEVKTYFVDKYSEWILLEPQRRGFNLLVYIVPVLALLAGATLVIVSVRRWSGRATVGAADAVETPDPDLAPWEDVRPGR